MLEGTARVPFEKADFPRFHVGPTESSFQGTGPENPHFEITVTAYRRSTGLEAGTMALALLSHAATSSAGEWAAGGAVPAQAVRQEGIL